MKDRNLICKFYIAANQCAKNKGCTIWKEMQHCGLYEPMLGSAPIRQDRRKNKKEKILKKERGDYNA